MTNWDLYEQRDRWTVRRNGLWQFTAGAEAAWAYVAAHAGDDDPVQVRYVTGRSGPALTGAGVRELRWRGRKLRGWLGNDGGVRDIATLTETFDWIGRLAVGMDTAQHLASVDLAPQDLEALSDEELERLWKKVSGRREQHIISMIS